MNGTLPSLRQVLEDHGLWAKRSLGQNFLLDPSVLTRIVKAAGPMEGRTIIEIGPGPGGLTRDILSQPIETLYAIEKDDRCIEILKELQAHYPDTLQIFPLDALTVDCTALGEAPRKIIANLPYNISVPLLLAWLRDIEHFESLTLMFQKEVAKRITAKPRSSAYGRLSVMSQWRCEAHVAFDLPPGAFTPPPKVTSTVIHIRPKAEAPSINVDSLEKVTATAFNQRRKMLRASLKSLISNPQELLEVAEIDPTKRAEELDVQDFCRLSQIYDALNSNGKPGS